LAFGYLMPLPYLTWSMRYGKVAGGNPWPTPSLEWQTASPPPIENFAVTPEVWWEPYDFVHRPDVGLAISGTTAAPATDD